MCTFLIYPLAVHPGLVNYESLGATYEEKRKRRAQLGFFLALCLLFFTTPVAMMGGLTQVIE